MTTLMLIALAVFLTLFTACGGSVPTSPSGSPTVSTAGPPASPASSFPAPSGPSRAFAFDHESSYRVSGYTRESRFVLFDNGAFVLQYTGRGEYRGAYKEATDGLTFEWEGVSSAGPWGATGTLAGSLLTIRYNQVMELSDFENAVYALAP
jgi:hypothetical protein